MRLSRKNEGGRCIEAAFKGSRQQDPTKTEFRGNRATTGTWKVYKGSVDSAKCCREL